MSCCCLGGFEWEKGCWNPWFVRNFQDWELGVVCLLRRLHEWPRIIKWVYKLYCECFKWKLDVVCLLRRLYEWARTIKWDYKQFCEGFREENFSVKAVYVTLELLNDGTVFLAKEVWGLVTSQGWYFVGKQYMEKF